MTTEAPRTIYQHDLQIVGEVSEASSWQQEKTFATIKCQTDPEYKEQAETQTIASALTVTEAIDKGEGTVPRQSLIPPAQMDGMQYTYNGPHFREDDVLNFLEEAQDDMLSMIQQNIKSTAFDHYEPNWSTKSNSVDRSHVLTAPHVLEGEWHVTGLAWNSNGSMLAVAYGRLDTVGWCKQRGFVCCWSFSRRDFDPNVPHQTMELDSYATTVAFHPILPAMLAVGTYNGEIALWSVSVGDESVKLMSSLGSENAPKEPVLRIQWLQNAQETREAHRYILCSASQDGKILFWATNNKFSDPLASYEIQNRKRNVVGVQAMAFVHTSAGLNTKGRALPPGLENLMLLGVESGEVFRTKPGVTSAVRQGAAATSSMTLEVDHYDAHRGPVNALDCSPFFRNLFLTSSSDGSLRLYSTLERNPVATLEPSVESRHYMYEAQFSPFRAAVLAAVSRSGNLHIYDLEKTRTRPIFTAQAGTDGAAVFSLAFNRASATQLATGDSKGRVALWQLSSELTQLTDLERAAVRAAEASRKEGDTPAGQAAPAVNAKTDAVRLLFGFGL
ncbi:WD40 repeat-containing protein, putative [Bodo saltans]|uniref:WD40 repeat-containing protein, putative n=1 Tax=Bodo saltans TaxID=75058 RepID=A0A0S4KLW0_BODSA|nr:WD40 repeat-containing protein, putative [Bodo saltans]|eukprot:CUI15399.1 WD40 repeat-containing protein, putative [Bodo saltans]